MTDRDIDSTSPLATAGPAAFSQLQQVTQMSTSVSLGTRLHLPPFTPKSARTWFQRAEVQFRLHMVSDEARKADLVMGMLPPEVFEELSSWLRSQEEVTYTPLKEQITTLFSLPAPIRAHRAFDLMATPLGDTSPRTAWNQLVDLLRIGEKDAQGRSLSVCVYREMFLRRLPTNIRAQLQTAETMEMDALVDKACNLHVAAQVAKYAATPSINAVGPVDEEDDALDPDINAVFSRKNQQRSQRPPRQRQRQQQPQKQFQKDDQCPGADIQPWCYYHRVWGSNAKKCSPPCRYPKN